MQKNIEAFAQSRHALITLLDIADKNAVIPAIEALIAGGIRAIEIPLRRTTSLECLAIAAQHFPDITVCAGTVVSSKQIEALVDLPIDFIVSPGINEQLLKDCQRYQLDILPGIATPSEIMLGIQYGLRFFKFFPAENLGGPETLKAFYGPFNQCLFCATGGINEENLPHYLATPNIFAAAGSWLVTSDDIQQQNWQAITNKAITACALANAKQDL